MKQKKWKNEGRKVGEEKEKGGDVENYRERRIYNQVSGSNIENSPEGLRRNSIRGSTYDEISWGHKRRSKH